MLFLSAFFALVVFKDNVINVDINPRSQIFSYCFHQLPFSLLLQSETKSGDTILVFLLLWSPTFLRFNILPGFSSI